MKNLFLFIRLLTGALFVFSGAVKLNDPSGFAIKLNEYFDVFSQDCPQLDGIFELLKDYSVVLSGTFCSLEVLLGFALLIGWHMKFTLYVATGLIVFFTFLTGYSAFFNKVTDCGCFGDFLHLEPWDSFKKDLILLVFVGILWAGLKFNQSLRLKKWANPLMITTTVLTVGFGLSCYYFLPVWDFLPYKKGNNIDYIINHIPPGERPTDSVEIRFVMQKGTDSVKVTTLQYSEFAKKGFTFIRQDRTVIVKGYQNPIHDFAIHDIQKGIDYRDSFLKYPGYQLLFISPFLSEMNGSDLSHVNRLYQHISKIPNVKFYALSSASSEAADAFCEQNQLNFHFFAADQKMLMTMARFNPTMYLFKGATVIEKWSGMNIPSPQELDELLKP